MEQFNFKSVELISQFAICSKKNAINCSKSKVTYIFAQYRYTIKEDLALSEEIILYLEDLANTSGKFP